jgi:nuclear transport factor 2 (NTF2) superfamily protein
LAPANTADSRWRNHADFFQSREATVAFLTRKWNRELDYRLVKELWAFHDDRIAVQFAYECMRRQWPWVPQLRQRELGIRCGGEMRRRVASINDLPIAEVDRRFSVAARLPARQSSVAKRARPLRESR